MFVKLKAMKEEHEVQIQEMTKIIQDQKRIIKAYNETVRTVNQLIETGEHSKLSSLYFHSIQKKKETKSMSNHW